jgi:hypothetical protein
MARSTINGVTMQMRYGRRLVCACALFISTLANAAPLPELIHAAPEAIRIRLAQPQNFFLRQNLYFARTYRVVSIDLDALGKQGSLFTMTILPGVVLTVETVSLEPSYSQTFWRGRIVGMREQGKEVDLSGADEYELALALSFNESNLEISPELYREIHSGAQEGFVVDDTRPAVPRDPPRIRVPIVTAQFQIPLHTDPILITCVSEDPRFHAVYEEAQERHPDGGPDSEEKARAIRDFEERLHEEKRQYESERNNNL